MLVTKIIDGELFRVYLMHGAARVSYSPDLVSVVFFPPVQRPGNIDCYCNKPHELRVIRPALYKPFHKVKIVWANLVVTAVVHTV